jgi:hypothetical protein
VEDEFHVLMSCSRYADLRIALRYVARQVFPSFDHESVMQQFVYMMACDEVIMVRALVDFLRFMFDRRSVLLSVPGFVMLP